MPTKQFPFLYPVKDAAWRGGDGGVQQSVSKFAVIGSSQKY